MPARQKTSPDPDDILMSALAKVAITGWSAAGYPGGAGPGIAHFADWADRQMLAALDAYHLETMKIRERIACAVMARLAALEPYKPAVRRAVAWHALPGRQAHAGRLVWRSADLIWHAAGDTSTDYNRYTKRGLLSGVLTATTIFWLNDTSPDHQNTREFLMRRLDDVVNVFGSLAKLKALKPGNGTMLNMAASCMQRARMGGQ